MQTGDTSAREQHAERGRYVPRQASEEELFETAFWKGTASGLWAWLTCRLRVFSGCVAKFRVSLRVPVYGTA